MASICTEILPAHVLRPVFEAEGTLDEAEWNYAPTVGCGPYVFSEWETGSYASFVRNENYYNEPAKIDEIFIRFVPDDAAQIAALRTGEGTWAPFSPTLTFPCWKKRGFRSSWPPAGITRAGTFTLARRVIRPWQDVRVRQAIAMCYRPLLPGRRPACWARPRWRPASGTTPPGRILTLSPGPTIPSGAKALLDEAGWVDSQRRRRARQGWRGADPGPRHYDPRGPRRPAGRCPAAVGRMWHPAGHRRISSDMFFTTYGEGAPCATGELDICEWSANTAYPDPDSSRWLSARYPATNSLTGSTTSTCVDEELDALFQLQTTQVDFAERQADLLRDQQVHDRQCATGWVCGTTRMPLA